MDKFDAKSILFACFIAGGKALYDRICKYLEENEHVDRGIIPRPEKLTYLDNQIATISQHYQEYAMSILGDIINFPYSFDETPPDIQKKFTDYLRQTIIEQRAVLNEKDIKYDRNLNLTWMVTNPMDPVPFNQRRVIFMNSSIKKYDSGSQKDLQGFISQFMTTKILIETMEEGSLDGVIVICSAAMNYHMPYHVFEKTKLLPDCIIICEPTGDTKQGPLGFSIGQKGYSKIALAFDHDKATKMELEKIIERELEAVPMSDHKDPIVGQGSINIHHTPTKHRIPRENESPRHETEKQVNQKAIDDIDAPHNADREPVLIKRTLGLDETWEDALNEVKSLPSVADKDNEKTSVAVTPMDNVPSWKTPRETRAILAATEAYRRVVSPWAATTTDTDELRVHPFFRERHEPDNFTGYPVRDQPPDGFEWVEASEGVLPPTFALGAGFSDSSDPTVRGDHVQATAAVMARFPSLFSEEFL